MRKAEERAQSAMEYLMTYGWAIVVIVIALSVIYYDISPSIAPQTSGCSPVIGFSCTEPLLYSSGLLVTDIGLIGSPKTITAIGCSANATEPSSFIALSTNIVLTSGESQAFTFNCPVTSALGTLFQGTLWVQYNAAGGVASQKVASVSLPVSATSTVAGPIIITYTAASSGNALGNAIATAPSSSAPLYLCAGALGENRGLPEGTIGTNFALDVPNPNPGGPPLSAVGHSASSNCQAYTTSPPNNAVASVLSISGMTSYSLYGNDVGSLGGLFWYAQMNLQFSVTGSNAFVVIAIACGYAACDNTPLAQSRGDPGTTSVPSGCNLATSEDLNGYQNTSIYTCDSLSPGSYNAVTTNDGNNEGAGASMDIAAYVFYNDT